MARWRASFVSAVTASLALAALLVTGEEASPPLASAASTSQVYTAVDADGGVYYRTEPSWDKPNGQPGVGIYTGDNIELICGQWGGPAGPYNNTWWHYVRNLSRPDIGDGWVSDHNLNTPNAAGDKTPGEPTCYDSGAAVQWALLHAYDPQPFDAACSFFVSGALWAGGLSKTDEWTDEGGHGFLWSHRPGTAAATSVELVSYLRKTYNTSWTDITANLTSNSVPQAQPGDVLAYDWEGDWDGQGVNGLDHLAFVVGIKPGQYPEVAEWGTVNASIPGTHPVNFYLKRGWTWSEKGQNWLQAEHPNMRVYLLQIRN